MRILLDESLPRKLVAELIGHETQTVQKRGWSGLSNGELLRRASQEYEVLITGDRNLQYQQNPATLPLAVIVLIAPSNRIENLRPLVPHLLKALKSIRRGELVRLSVKV